MMRDTDNSHLFAPFAEYIMRFEAALRDARLPFYQFEGYRSWDKQKAEWSKGRSKPGPVVTWALPGDSWHQYGFACDWVADGMLDKPGIQWAWDLKADANADGRRDWEQMAEIAVSCGLEAGWYWPEKKCDPPHVQHRFGLTIPQARKLYEAGGMSGVWAEAEKWIENQIWP